MALKKLIRSGIVLVESLTEMVALEKQRLINEQNGYLNTHGPQVASKVYEGVVDELDATLEELKNVKTNELDEYRKLQAKACALRAMLPYGYGEDR